MSIFPDNQPVIFVDETDSCACDSTYCQLVQTDDTTQFQAKIYPCVGTLEELPALQDEGWQAQGAFSIGRDGACKTTGSTGTLNYYNVTAVDTYYFLEVNVGSIFGEVEVYSGGTLLGTITATGISSFAFLATNANIRFYVGNSEHTVCITSVSLRVLSDQMSVGVIDSTDTVVGYANIIDAPGFFELSKDTVTVSFSWGDITTTAGCYRIVFATGCSGQFGTFNGDFVQWEENVPRGWSEDSSTGAYTLEKISTNGELLFTSVGAAATLALEQDYDTYLVGKSYTVRLNIKSLKAGTSVQVNAGGNLSSSYNTAGVKTFTVVMGAGSYLKLLFDAPLANDTIEITSIRAKLTNSSDVVWDYTSNCFKLATEWDCTHVLNISQDEDAFGMVFEGNNFAPRIRVESRLVNSAYESNRVSYHDNNGTKYNHYFERRKHQFLKVNFQPTYVHDFLSLALGSDHFFIDGNAYFIEDEDYTPNFPDSIDDLASIILEVSKKTQLVKNIASGNASNPIAANQDTFYIVDPSNRSVIITEPLTGDTLKSL